MSRDDEGTRGELLPAGAVTGSMIREHATSAMLVPEMQDLQPEEIVGRVKKWTEVIRQLGEHALSVTEPRHWTNYEGTPWLNGNGADLMVSMCGLSVEFDRPAYDYEEGTDKSGPWFIYTCRLVVGLARWSRVAVLGTCSSRDPFFSHGQRLAADKVTRDDVKKAAYSNALCNGVGRILGLRRMTWEDIAEVTRGKVSETNVESAGFKGGSKGGTRKRKDSPPPEQTKANARQRSAVWADYCRNLEIDPKRPPEGEGDKFKAWVADVCPEASKLDRNDWTVAHCEQLRDAAKTLTPDNMLPADEREGAAQGAEAPPGGEDTPEGENAPEATADEPSEGEQGDEPPPPDDGDAPPDDDERE